MKAIVGLLLVAILANKGVDARRELTRSASSTAIAHGSATAVAMATSTGGSEPTSATATSTSKGCGAKSTTVAVARDGADVDAATHTEAEDCAKVEGTTVAEGEGEDADVKVETVVKSDEDIDVTVFVKRYNDGEEVKTVAAEIVKTYDGFVYKRVAGSLLGLAGDEKTYELFEETLVLFVEKIGCKEFKLVIVGFEDDFSKYTLPASVDACFEALCSEYESAKHCCGKAQLEQDQCACEDGVCAWTKPDKQDDARPFWACSDCGHKIRGCYCA